MKRSSNEMRKPARHRLASPENLECRLPLDGDFEEIWGGDARLTISFAPDETLVAEHPSHLFAAFDARFPTEEWQGEILRAFQTWARETNADIGVVSDRRDCEDPASGSLIHCPFGTPGALQRDPRFGDIRVGAIPLQGELFAASVTAAEAIDGTWAGDLLFNAELIGKEPFDELPELFAVALHEAGHVFGLEHSDDPQSPMHTHGVPASVIPTPADIAALHNSYGARSHDVYDLGGAGANPIEIRPFEIDDNAERGTAPTVVFGDVHDDSDQDLYMLHLDDLDGFDFDTKLQGLRFQLITSRMSQLSPHLEIRRVIDSSPWTTVPINTVDPVAAGAGDDIEIVVPKNQATGLVRDDILEITIKTSAADETRTGGYTLLIWYDGITDPCVTAAVPLVEDFVRFPVRLIPSDDLEDFFEDGFQLLVNKDLGLNDLPGTETQLDTTPGFVDGTRYELYASIELANDIDRYRINSPGELMAGDRGTLTLRSTNPEFSGALTVSDQLGQTLPVEVLVHNHETLVVQFGPILPNTDYLVKIEADVTATTPAQIGSYELLALLGTEEIQRTPLAAGTLNDATVVHQYSLRTNRPQLFQFVLSADAAMPGNAAIRLEIFDEHGVSVALLESTTGDTRSLAVLLPKGRFRLKVSLSSGIGPVTYTLKGAAVDNPLGPRIDDGSVPYTFIRIRGALVPLVAFAQ